MTPKDKQDYTVKIHSALQSIRPYLQADGGDIEFVSVSDDLSVEVKLTGACHGCPMSVQTMKFGVEQTLKNAIPEIKEVIAVDEF